MTDIKQTAGERGVYRRGLGIACVSAGIIMSLASGFGFYQIDSSLIWPVLITGLSLLGVGLIKDTKWAKP